MKDYKWLIHALEGRAESLRQADLGDLNWVLLDDAVHAIKVLSGGRYLDRIISNGSTDRLKEILDTLLYIQNVMDNEQFVSVKWIYDEISMLLNGANYE